MTSSNLTLPDFENPPLTEVLLSVQFEPILNMQVPQIGLLWSRIRERFPNTEQHSPLEPAIETFGPPSPPKIQLSLSQSPPLSRTWFLNEAGTELIQIQNDRFMHNWRRVEDQETYPRYEYVRAQFSRGLEDFYDFLLKEELGELVPNQCEIGYINHIETNHIWSAHSELEKVLALWNPKFGDGGLPDMESVRIETQHSFKDGNDHPMGRLHISAQPAFTRSDNSPLLVLTLTARGAPSDQTSGGVLDFMDKGRERIVRGFASITTPEMHKIWRRIR